MREGAPKPKRLEEIQAGTESKKLPEGVMVLREDLSYDDNRLGDLLRERVTNIVESIGITPKGAQAMTLQRQEVERAPSVYPKTPNEILNPQSLGNPRPIELRTVVYLVGLGSDGGTLESIGLRGRGSDPVVQRIYRTVERALEIETEDGSPIATAEGLAGFVRQAATFVSRERELTDSRDTKGLIKLYDEVAALERRYLDSLWVFSNSQ